MPKLLLVAAACAVLVSAAGPARAKERPEGAKAKAPAVALALVPAGLCTGRVVDGSDALATMDATTVPAGVEEAIAAALRGGDVKCRPWAALALGRINAWRAVPALPIVRQALASDEELVRLEAYETLRHMGPLAQAVLADLEKAASSENESLRPFATAALESLRDEVQVRERPFGLRLMALGRQEGVPVAYMLDETGRVYEIRGGEQFLDGTIARVSDDAVEFDGRRVMEDFSILPYRSRIRLFGGGAPAPIPVVAGEHTGGPVSVEFAGALNTFAMFMAQFGPLNVIVEAGGSPTVQVAALETPWDAVVHHALAQAGLASRVESLYVRLGRPEQLERHPRLPDRKYDGILVTLQLHGAEMESLATVLGQVGKTRIELPPGPHERVAVYVTEVPWDEVLEMIAVSRGWTTTREGDRIVLKPAGP